MKIVRFILLLIILSIAITTLYFFFQYKNYTNNPLGSDSNKIRFEIEEGMTGDRILEGLSEAGIIEEKAIPYLKAYLRINNVPEMKQGVFRVPKNLTAKELFDLLQKPENPDIWITIREGSRIDQVANILKEEFSKEPESVFNVEKFNSLVIDPEYISTLGLSIEGLTTLEGFLYPDKYLIPKQATEDYIIKTLVNTFIQKTGGIYTYEDIVIASMVEREGMTDQDRPMIADIIKRRLAEGWLLQIDATILYHYKDWRRVITKADLELDQPYNTYTRPGLPPTPICSPSISSINATKNPKPNNYYFYIHAKDGTPYYAETYQDHLVNISKYLR